MVQGPYSQPREIMDSLKACLIGFNFCHVLLAEEEAVCDFVILTFRDVYWHLF